MPTTNVPVSSPTAPPTSGLLGAHSNTATCPNAPIGPPYVSLSSVVVYTATQAFARCLSGPRPRPTVNVADWRSPRARSPTCSRKRQALGPQGICRVACCGPRGWCLGRKPRSKLDSFFFPLSRTIAKYVSRFQTGGPSSTCACHVANVIRDLNCRISQSINA